MTLQLLMAKSRYLTSVQSESIRSLQSILRLFFHCQMSCLCVLIKHSSFRMAAWYRYTENCCKTVLKKAFVNLIARKQGLVKQTVTTCSATDILDSVIGHRKTYRTPYNLESHIFPCQTPTELIFTSSFRNTSLLQLEHTSSRQS